MNNWNALKFCMDLCVVVGNSVKYRFVQMNVLSTYIPSKTYARYVWAINVNGMCIMAIKLFAVYSEIMLVDKCVPCFGFLYCNRFKAIFESSYLLATMLHASYCFTWTIDISLLNEMINKNNKTKHKLIVKNIRCQSADFSIENGARSIRLIQVDSVDSWNIWIY